MFTVIAIVCAFVAGAGFISSLTNVMTRLTILSSQQDRQSSRLKNYLRHRGISTNLKMRITHSAKYVMLRELQYSNEESIELLECISKPLRMELHHEIYAPVLKTHSFFCEYDAVNPIAMQNLCHTAVRERTHHKGDVIFTEGERPHTPCMLLVVDGQLVFTSARQGYSVERVRAGQSVSEMVLWVTGWVHRGTLRAALHSVLVVLEAEAFHKVASEYRLSAFYPARYAQAVYEQLAELDYEQLDDLRTGLDEERLMNVVFDKAKRTSTRSRQSVSSKTTLKSASTENSWQSKDSVESSNSWRDRRRM
jgi:hypothetical protein